MTTINIENITLGLYRVGTEFTYQPGSYKDRRPATVVGYHIEHNTDTGKTSIGYRIKYDTALNPIVTDVPATTVTRAMFKEAQS